MAKQKEEPKQQWSMTKKEVKQLQDFQAMREASHQMLEDLLRIEARALKNETAWWETMRLSHNIPEDVRFDLVADSGLGKIWIKGKVPSLDSSRRGRVGLRHNIPNGD